MWLRGNLIETMEYSTKQQWNTWNAVQVILEGNVTALNVPVKN